MKRFLEFLLFLAFACSTLIIIIMSLSPKPEKIKGCITTSMTKVYLCPDSENYIQLKEVSPELKEAIVISEDIGFFQHKGFDFHEIKESIVKNFKKAKLSRGGSTITQQLVKNVFLSREKSFSRKIQEAYLTYRVEGFLSKDQIFEKYLNVVEFGSQVYGVKSAAWYYFGKKPSELHLLESIYLAHLLPSPIRFSKFFGSGLLSERSEKIIGLILKRMVLFNKISTARYKYYEAQLLNFPWKNLSPYQENEQKEAIKDDRPSPRNESQSNKSNSTLNRRLHSLELTN